MASDVWGIDIGNSSVKAVKMSRRGNLAVITDFDVVEIPPTEDEEARLQGIDDALGELKQRKTFSSTDLIYLSIPANQAFFREFKLPAFEVGKMEQMIRFDVGQVGPFPLDEEE